MYGKAKISIQLIYLRPINYIALTTRKCATCVIQV